MAGFAKNIAPYVTYSVTSQSISLYIDPKVSAIFDSPGANYCNVSCNGQQTGIRSTGYPNIVFNGLSPSTRYAVTIDVMYAAGYGGNYGYQTIYITTAAPTYCTLTFNHYLQLANGSTSSSPSATTSASVEVNSYVYLPNYNYGFASDSYYYSYGCLQGTSTIVGGFYASGNATYNLYYARTTYNISAVAGTGIDSVKGSNTTWWGNTITTVAYTSTGYNFSKWVSNSPTYLSDSTNPNYTFVVPKTNVTLTATATKKTAYTLNLYCSGYTATVTGNTTTSTNGGSISITAYAGDTVTISCTKPSNTSYYTYTLQGWYTAANGGGDRWSSSMSFTYTMPATNVTLYAYTTRTAGFAWAIAKTVGSKTLTAAEWQALQSFVNTQRTTAYTFQYIPSVGDTLSAAMYNEMVAAIGKGTTVSKGQAISASLMNALVTDANAMK